MNSLSRGLFLSIACGGAMVGGGACARLQNFARLHLGGRPSEMAEPASNVTPSNPSDLRTQVRIGMAKTPYAALLCVAQSEGFFRQEGLDVTLIPNPTGPQSLENLASDQLDFVTTMIYAYAQSLNQPKKPGRILAEIASGSRDYYMVTFQNQDLNTPKKLEGRSIGYSRSATSDAVADYFYTSQGLSTKKMRRVVLEHDKLISAFREHKIDVLLASDPFLSELQNVFHGHDLNFFKITMNPLDLVLIANPSSLKGDLTVQRKVLRALIQAEPVIDSMSDATLTQLDKCFTGYGKENLRKAVDSISFHVVAGEQMRFQYGQAADWVRRNSTAYDPLPPPFEEVFFRTALASVKPSRVLLQ